MHVFVHRSMKPIFRIMEPANLQTSNPLVFLLLLIVSSSANLPDELCVKMLRQRSTSRRGRVGRGGGRRKVNLGATNGFFYRLGGWPNSLRPP